MYYFLMEKAIYTLSIAGATGLGPLDENSAMRVDTGLPVCVLEGPIFTRGCLLSPPKSF